MTTSSPMTSSQMLPSQGSQVMAAPPVYMTSPGSSSGMMMPEQPVMQMPMGGTPATTMPMEQMPATGYTTMAPQMGTQGAMPMGSMQYSAPGGMVPPVGTVMVAEPVATRVEPAGMVMEQQAVPTRIEATPATTYGAPTTTYISGAQPGVMVGGTTMVGGTVQQEGFLQHAMHTVGNALGFGSQAPTTTYVQGGAPLGSVQSAPGVTYGAPGTMTTMSAPGGGYAVGGAGSANLFDQID